MHTAEHPTSVEHRKGVRLTARVIAIALVAALAFPSRHAAGATNGGAGSAVGSAVGESVAEGAAVVVGVSVAAIAVLGLGVWWFFLHDGDDDVPEALAAQGGAVDVSSGAKVGLDCPGANGGPSVACW